jgi:hypothetical protein
MRLRSFEVKGFKNLRLPIRLEDLGPVNVVHGDNNVGKSNLLESIELYFDLLRRCVCDKPGHGLHPQERRQALDQRRSRYPFDLRLPRPIDLRGVIAVNADEVARFGLEVTHPADAVEIAVRAVPGDGLGSMTFGVTAFRYGDGFDAALLPEDDPESVKAAQLLRVIARADGGKPEPTPHTFAHVDIGRQVNGRDETRDGLVAQVLVDRLYNARESLTEYPLWNLFTSVMEEFQSVLGAGEFLVTATLGSHHAQLVRQTQGARIPVALLGSGVQQVIELVARLILSRADIVAIEEPELNLRHTLQERLREIFLRIAASVDGQQIFLTSHSYAFETGTFYAMDATPDGPVVTKRSSELARAYTGYPAEATPVGASAPVSYVNNEGLVRVPAPVLGRLGLQHGGGVVFVERDDGHVEMLSNAQYFEVVGE